MRVDADGGHLLAFVSIFLVFCYYQVLVLCVADYYQMTTFAQLTQSLSCSWLCCFMAQMNPLMGPRLHQGTLLIVAREWGNMPEDINSYVPVEPPAVH